FGGQPRQDAHLSIGRIGFHLNDAHGKPRKFAPQAVDIFERRLGSAADAEQDLEFRILFQGMRTQRLVEAFVAAVHGFEDRDGRLRTGYHPVSRLPPCPTRIFPAQGGDDGEELIGGRRQSGQSPPAHKETSATPQTTSNAPAQRSQLTCSRRTYL